MNARKIIQDSDAIIIVASNGLSISEGYHIFACDQRFQNRFHDFYLKYGIQSMIQGCFASLNPCDKWVYMSRVVDEYSLKYTGSDVMKDLYKLVENKDYFVFTSNADNHFQISGFDKSGIFEIEGNMTYMQCSHACHDTLYPIDDTVDTILKHQAGTSIDSKYLPRCPKCNEIMQVHVMMDHSFVQDQSYIEAYNRFNTFLKENYNKNIVVLELGVGSKNQMIKRPMMDYIASTPNGKYISINLNDFYIPESIKDKSLILSGYIDKIIKEELL